MIHMANQAKLRSYNHTPKYKCGFCIPMTYHQAIKLDKRNNNPKWRYCTQLEVTQLNKYEIFTDLGKDGKPPTGYKTIGAHFVYDIKHDGRHKSRYVADD